MVRSRSSLVVPILALAVTLAADDAAAQSLLERSPNLSGGWVGGPHSLHFNFLHRFNQSGPPQRQVMNRPTFLLAYGARTGTLLGVQYATRSDIVVGLPNEWELFGRQALLREDRGAPVDLAAQLSYNHSAESVDGEVSLARRIGPLRLLAAGRGFSSGYGEGTRYAVAAGAALRLGTWFAVSGDVAQLLAAADDERLVWGAAVQVGIPLTPHTFSVQAVNTNSATLQGSSRGARERRWGFEFTVPVALARYGRRTPPPVAQIDHEAQRAAEDSLRHAAVVDSISEALRARYELRYRQDSLRLALRDDSVRLAQQLDSLRAVARADSIRRAEAAAAEAAAEAAQREEQRRQQPARQPVRAGMRNLAFEPARIVIDVGTTVIWRNNDQVEHTVTARNGSFDSGTMRPGATWQHTFTRPGTYDFTCTPHPFMTGVVIVRARP
jgi:plastocyanin